MIAKIIAFVLLAIFYVVYFGKKISQRKKGIQTNQIGIGSKPKRMLWIERLMGAATVLIVPMEVLSIVVFPQWTLIPWLASSSVCQWVGLLLTALGILFFISAVLSMKDSWRAGIPEKDETQLVQNGIYRISRNPAFVGFDLMYIGLLLAFPNLLHLVFALFPMIMLHLQILQEETFCRSSFGAPYEAYCKKVRRYL